MAYSVWASDCFGHSREFPYIQYWRNLRRSRTRTCCAVLAAGAGWEDWVVFFSNLSCRSFPGRPLDMAAIMCYPLGRGRCQLLSLSNG